MDDAREKLVRRHFEAYRDLTWIEHLEPRFMEYGMDSARRRELREAWNEHAEVKDWAWWQKECEHKPNERLEDEIMDINDRLDALGKLKWHELLEELQADYAAGKREDAHWYGKAAPQQPPENGYDKMLKEAANRAPVNDHEKGRER